MNVRWANASRTYVRLVEGDTVSLIPADPRHPDWQQIAAMVEAGSLVIGPYQPAQLQETPEE